tara:strand:+ start:8582 stop:11839 length:3258 start_codon:yes stop_codon:yes gene_type:complete
MNKSNKKIKIKQKSLKKKQYLHNTLLKIKKYYNVIQDSILSLHNYKSLDILKSNDIHLAIHQYQDIYDRIFNIHNLLNTKKNIDYDEVATKLQNINNELSILFKNYGTKNIMDLLSIQFGSDYVKELYINNKFSLISKYVHPIGFKLMDWKIKTESSKKTRIARNRIVEDFMITENSESLDCFDLSRSSSIFQTKVYGIKISFQNTKLKKTLIMDGIMDDVILNCCNDNYIKEKMKKIKDNVPKEDNFENKDFERFVKILTLKDILIYNETEIYHKYNGYISKNNLTKQKTISESVKEFLTSELYTQRYILIQLLIKANDPEFQYLAYLLYDLLSNEINGSVDTTDQTILYDSLPWEVKKYFKDAMKNTIKYTKEISNFETTNIPLEQQICLLKATNTVKEKAMIKLKEVKAKSEDSGSKARQYLEGLLKVPFGVYKKEKILDSMKRISLQFNDIIQTIEPKITDISNNFNIEMKENYTNIDILQNINYLKYDFIEEYKKLHIDKLIKLYTNNKRSQLIDNICYINRILKKKNIKEHICHSGKKVEFMKLHIKNTILKHINNNEVIEDLKKKFENKNKINTIQLTNNINMIEEEWEKLNVSMKNTYKTLDEAVHGHKNAKRQVERIIGQWISGEQTGYCFGFEGPPGVGKTSLARKGLANCLKDENGETRPFSFIALGGASNGSTLAGHNYTYVGSTWGKIVDVLIEKKCMNPIIFIDELDKISKTENGKEIIGILTHLVDRTQNEQFQDKYFSGIDLDLSKALFIFSYNDVSAIDKILLDRIHRIKFDNLLLSDKITIVKTYILPELYDKFNIQHLIFSDEIIRYIIDTYTNEPGVRKLKEILFEIISEINLEILNKNNNLKNPFDITKELIKDLYLKDKPKMIHKVIHKEPGVGIINGLWANSLGMGGIIPIETSFFPSNTFLDFKLTGLQGDVMKESMNVAKTLAWKLTKKKTQLSLIKNFKTAKLQGIHIHCPEGAVPKDGPSAGTAITTCMYSLFNKKKIKNNIAITGEIDLHGNVTQIGGLDLKILGGIKAGVNTFIYPTTNKDDFDKFMEKQENKDIFNNIKFIPVSKIDEVLKIVFI